MNKFHKKDGLNNNNPHTYISTHQNRAQKKTKHTYIKHSTFYIPCSMEETFGSDSVSLETTLFLELSPKLEGVPTAEVRNGKGAERVRM